MTHLRERQDTATSINLKAQEIGAFRLGRILLIGNALIPKAYQRFSSGLSVDQTFGLSKGISSVSVFVQLLSRVSTIYSLKRDGCKHATKSSPGDKVPW
jgi:hypothetical protein